MVEYLITYGNGEIQIVRGYDIIQALGHVWAGRIGDVVRIERM